MPAPEPMTIDQLRELVRDVPNFPIPGILFRDITPLLANGEALHTAVALLASPFDEIDVVVAIESRGFILGAPVALELGAGLAPVRKPGRLPYATIRADYELEYGANTLEMHRDAVRLGFDEQAGPGGGQRGEFGAARVGQGLRALGGLADLGAVRADHQQIERAEVRLDIRDGAAADDRDAAAERAVKRRELRRHPIGHMNAVGGIGDLDQRPVEIEEQRERTPGREPGERRGRGEVDAFVHCGKG